MLAAQTHPAAAFEPSTLELKGADSIYSYNSYNSLIK